MEDIFDDLAVEDNENVENDENKDLDEDAENKKRIVKVRRVVNKRPTLDHLRLTGPRGIGAIENLTKKVKFKGKGKEKEDLAKIISVLHYWCHILYPKMTFGDCLEKIEILGKKRPTMTYLTKMRLGTLDEDSPTNDSSLVSLSEPATSDSEQQAITDEQKERILKNKKLAQERRAAKLQAMKIQDEAFDNLLKS